MATRRRFTQEYQDQAVSLVLHSGRTIREVAKSIGVHEITLGKWVNKAKGDDSGRDKELSETARAELERLRKENAVLRMERDFAKKVIMPAGVGTGGGTVAWREDVARHD